MENSEQSYNHKHHVLERRGKSDLVSLNFKVPFNVRQQFKIHAALSGVSMTEFLLQLLKEKIR